jgi:branched-chain amino acid transport system substrate-binding protein
MRSQFPVIKAFLMILCCMQASYAITAVAADEVKTVAIGFAGPLAEGPAQSARDAALLAIREINARPPQIAGEKVIFKLLDQDDKGDVNIAALTARYFVASKVVAVIGHWNTSTSIATAGIYGDAGIVQISPSSTGSQFTQQGLSTTFRMVGHDGIRSGHIGAYALNILRAQRIVVIDDGTVFGSAMADQFAVYVRENGGRIVGRTTISNKTSDFSPALDMVRQAKPDLIFHAGRLYSGGLNHSENLIGGLRRLGFPKKMILAEVTADPATMKEAALGGIDIFAVSPGLPLDKLPRWKAFQKSFSTQFTSRITPYTPAAYDAVHVLAEALRQANSWDPQKISAALRAVRYAGVTGLISFDEKGNLINPAYTVYQLREGAWTPIELIRK